MNDWKKIIFLDVDGVVNSDDWYNKTRGRSGDFDPESLALLNQLQEVDAEVVISSSWGETAIKPLQDVGLKLPIIGTTAHFYQDWLCRGNEIEKWLLDNFGGMASKYGRNEDGVPYYRSYNHDHGDYEYVIFDDDCDFLLGQKDNFIRTDKKTGVTQADIDKAKKILTRQ